MGQQHSHNAKPCPAKDLLPTYRSCAQPACAPERPPACGSPLSLFALKFIHWLARASVRAICRRAIASTLATDPPQRETPRFSFSTMVAKAIVQEEPEDSGSVDFEAVVLTKDGQEATSKAPRSLSLQQPLAVEAMPDVPFSHLCNRGFAITRTNWLVKLWRYFIVPTKELYLPFMTNKMPTNFLMVSNARK